MVLRTSDYNRLTLNQNVIDEVFNDSMVQALDKQTWLEIFNVKMDNNKSYTTQLNHWVSGIKRIPEWATYPQASWQEGDYKTFVQEKYWVDFTVTKENKKFDQYDEVVENMQSLTDEWANLIDQSLSEVLENWASISYTNIYWNVVSSIWADWLALFSASHTNWTTSSTYSNIITDWTNTNPALSQKAIERTISEWLQYTDPQGVNRPINFDTILVWPKLKWLAERICYTDLLAQTANNDINPLKWKINVKVWSKLGLTATTDDYFFMYDSSKVEKTLKTIFTQMPMLQAKDKFYPNMDTHYLFDYFYQYGFVWQAYIRQSLWDLS